MHCPNCLEKMEEVVMDAQKILHCPNCGSSFFEENGINRITANTAKKLAESKKGIFMPDTKKLCPRDNTTILMPIRGDEAIPPAVTLFKCASCRGIFAYPTDLLMFKKAQDVKIDFYKTWGTPLPSLRSVLVLSFFAIIGISLISSILYSYNRNTTSTQASEVLKGVNFVKSNIYLFVSFKTDIAAKSSIVFTDKTTGQTFTKVISDKLERIHYTTITDLNLEDQISYHIVLTDDNGKQITTPETMLEVK